jgi:putative redox protein
MPGCRWPFPSAFDSIRAIINSGRAGNGARTDGAIRQIPVTADCPNPTRSNIAAGKHTIIIDEPTSCNGNDEGMLPLSALMASLASCTRVVANQIASELGIVFRDSHIAVRGTFDTRCYTGEARGDPPFPEIDMTVTLATDATDEQLDDLKEQLRWRCPVAATFSGAGTKINETWNVTPA